MSTTIFTVEYKEFSRFISILSFSFFMFFNQARYDP